MTKKLQLLIFTSRPWPNRAVVLSMALLLGVVAQLVVAADASAKNRRPQIRFVNVSIDGPRPSPGFPTTPTIDLRFRYCDDSRGAIDYAAGPGRMWVRITRRSRGRPVATQTIVEPTLPFDSTCIRYTFGSIIKRKLAGSGRLVVLFRVRDPQGRWSRTVRKQRRPIFLR